MLDPVSSDGAELLEYMQLFLDHNVPAQLGVLLVPQADSEVGVAVCQAFAYTVHALSPRQAFHWLVQVRGHLCCECVAVMQCFPAGPEYVHQLSRRECGCYPWPL